LEPFKTTPAARILEVGRPCMAVIVASQPLGLRNQQGEDLYALSLTVISDGGRPYRVQVGNPVPAHAARLLYAGSAVPAKRLPDSDEGELAIDWDAAVAYAAPGGPWPEDSPTAWPSRPM
jgi:hypothetical protein